MTEFTKLLTKYTKRDYQEDSNHENGNYQNICFQCSTDFIGHKRRILCKQCLRDNLIASLGKRIEAFSTELEDLLSLDTSSNPRQHKIPSHLQHGLRHLYDDNYREGVKQVRKIMADKVKEHDD